VDPAGVTAALDRCAALIARLAGGTVRSGRADAYPRRHRPANVALRWARPGEILGLPIGRREARRILAALGFEERKVTAKGAVYRVPSWRLDVAREEDLVEEIVRLKGFDAIPETLPPVASETPVVPREAEVAERARQALLAAGFSEAVNFSFVAPADLAAMDPRGGADRGIALKNPISAELAVMRTGLLPSLLRNAAHNLRQRVEDVRLFEIANAYRARPPGVPAEYPAVEEPRIAGVALGRRHPVGWGAGRDPVDFYDLKGALEGLAASLGIDGVRWTRGGEPWLHPRAAASLEAEAPGGRHLLGWAGEVHPRVARAFELPRGVLAFELSFAALARHARLVPGHAGVPRFPAVLRDLAVVVAEEVEAGRVLSLVRDEPLVEDVTLFDVYRGPPVPAGHKNLAMAIRYRAADRTLTDAEAEGAHGRIVERLRVAAGAQVRA
jgi:phenylalanyl-tRNA synthetase beta chain